MKKLKQILRKVLPVLLIVALSAAMFAIGHIVGEYKQSSKTSEYYIKTEALLDTIYVQQQDYMDVLMETDVYYYYSEAKYKLNEYGY